MSVDSAAAASRDRGPIWEVLWVFLRLGATSFGGPIAHLGYFRAEFVVRRRWSFRDPRHAAGLITSPPTGLLQAQSCRVCKASRTRSVSCGARPTSRLVA